MNTFFNSAVDYWCSANKNVLNFLPESEFRNQAVNLIDAQARISKEVFQIVTDTVKSCDPGVFTTKTKSGTK